MIRIQWFRVGALVVAALYAASSMATAATSERIDWETPSARFVAQSMSFDGNHVAIPRSVEVTSDPGGPTYRTIEAAWNNPDGPYRLVLWLRANDTMWWVDEVALQTPLASAHWGGGGVPQFQRTPRSTSLVADIHLSDPPLEIIGLRLSAFMPRTGPAPLAGCRHLGAGETLDVTTLSSRVPAEVGGALSRDGLCFTYRFTYPVEGTDMLYSERWCKPPATGVVVDLDRLDDGEVIVFVRDEHPRPIRNQPPEGWSCEAW